MCGATRHEIISRDLLCCYARDIKIIDKLIYDMRVKTRLKSFKSNQVMPDKIYKRCGKDCVRCWRNKLKHANPESKKYIKKMGEEKADYTIKASDDIDGQTVPGSIDDKEADNDSKNMIHTGYTSEPEIAVKIAQTNNTISKSRRRRIKQIGKLLESLPRR